VKPWRSAPELDAGIRSFRAGETRAAHESFEEVWRAHSGTTLGEVARALSQWAAACVHREAGRDAGFRSLAAKAAARLAAGEVDAEHGTRALSERIARFAAGDGAADVRSVLDDGAPDEHGPRG
jgi:predicted metal-dependent hydrolase